MAERFKSLSTRSKAIMIIGLIVFIGITWWLVSPLFLDGKMLNEDLDTNVTVLASGQLQRMDETHYGIGTVKLVEKTNGNLEIQFDNVEIANGPGLVVYLSDTASFASKYSDPGVFEDLGSLEANIGTFAMDVPKIPSFEIKSIIIWCEPAGIVFSFASLS